MKRLFALLCGIAWAGVSGAVGAAAYSSLYIFGDSLSDVGNNFIALGGATTQVSQISNTFVPTFPYASGHYTNGDIWAQSFASMLKLSDPVTPSLLGGNDFAFGGARTSPQIPAPPPPVVPTLTEQKAAFLARVNNVAPSSALYVVAGGGNNARDAAIAILSGADRTTTITDAVNTYATDIAGIVHDLEVDGAQHIVVWNVPDIGKTPAVLSFGQAASAEASTLVSLMNGGLQAALGNDDHVKVFDLFGTVDDAVNHPDKYGLANMTDACGQFPIGTGVGECDPSKYLFWDGIHPTSGGHQLIADALFRTVVPEPTVFALVVPGVVLVALIRRRSRT